MTDFIESFDGKIYMYGSNRCFQAGTQSPKTFTGEKIFDYSKTGKINKVITDSVSIIMQVKPEKLNKHFGTVDGFYIIGKNTRKLAGRKTYVDRPLHREYKIKEIYCGKYHAFLYLRNNSLYGCGLNDHNQLGLDVINYTTENSARKIKDNIMLKKIVCGLNHSVLWCENDEIIGFGSDDSGQLAFTKHNKSDLVDKNIKDILCGDNFTLIHVDNKLYYYGKKCDAPYWDNHRYEPRFVLADGNIKDVVCSENHILILYENNSVWSCGSNQYGKLGLGLDPTTCVTKPAKIDVDLDVNKIMCNDTSSFIHTTFGELYIYGLNNFPNNQSPVLTKTNIKSINGNIVNPINLNIKRMYIRLGQYNKSIIYTFIMINNILFKKKYINIGIDCINHILTTSLCR